MYDIKLDDIDIVVFDFDETIARSIDSFLMSEIIIRYESIPYCTMKDTMNYNEELNALKDKQVRKWNFGNVLPNITIAEVEDVFSSKVFFECLDIYHDMIEAMRWFKHQGKEVVILSLGTPMNLHWKSKYIYDNIPDDCYDQVILGGSVGEVKMDKSIYDFGNRSVLIDDNQDNLFSSKCRYKICSKLYTDEPTDWNDKWKGLSIRSGQELINLFR